MNGRDRGEFALLQAVASSRIGDNEDVKDALRRATAFSIASVNPTLESEVEYYRGVLNYGAGNFRTAEAASFLALDVASSRPTARKRSGFIPLAHVVSRSEELLGILSEAKGDSIEALRYARAALSTLEASATPDAYQEAFAIRNLSVFACDLDSIEDTKHLTKRASTFAWTLDTANARFVTLKTLAMCAALRGDISGALRGFRNAATSAKINPEFAYIAAGRALVAHELGHQDMAAEEIDYALDQAAGYDWNKAPDDYRLVLLCIAQVAAAMRSTRARRMLDLYSCVRAKVDPAYLVVSPRIRASEAYAHGLVLRAEGRLVASLQRFEEAFVTWTHFGYEWNAARAALELLELDPRDAFRLAVRRDLVKRPDSIYAKRARRAA